VIAITARARGFVQSFADAARRRPRTSEATMRFRNRESAGALLAKRLATYRRTNPLVLGIPRGAVPMAGVIAEALDADLDVVLVRKVGAPGNPEFAAGAVSEDGEVVVNPSASAFGIRREYVAEEAAAQLDVLRHRRARLSAVHAPVDPAGRVVIVVDDGGATGSTMLSALQALRRRRPKWLVAAMAVAPPEAVERIADFADDVVCLETPEDFRAVGQFFDEFAPVTDDEVVETLREFHRRRASSRSAPSTPAGPRRVDVSIPAGTASLEGELVVPAGARGIVLFAHGSGSGRKSPRNTFVAERLQRRGLATLLMDLLTEEEDLVRDNRFDIDLLTRRLEAATRWVGGRRDVGELPIGYFGASTGAACALRAAADLEHRVGAVVSRGGRPDLADEALALVRAPTLLIVGGADDVVIELNRDALARLTCEKEMEIVPGATHLFEEAGALEQVAELAGAWFEAHLAHGAPRPLPTVA
jgi:putative phosphoribosyl transferase